MEDNTYEGNKHFRSRAVGQLFVQLTKKPVVNQITVHEMEFDSSKDASKFMSFIGQKYATKNTLMNNRKLKHISMFDRD